MKTISVTTKKVTIIVGVIMAILILLVFNASAEPENDLRYKSEVVKIQQAVNDLAMQTELDCEQLNHKKVLKFFDDNENLLYESEVNMDKVINDEKLIKLLHQSDLVVNLDHTSFYRFNK